MRHNRTLYLCLVILVPAILVGYQNCSPEKFSASSSSVATQGSPPIFVMSPADQAALVGWYTYTPNTSAANSPTNPPAPNVNFSAADGSCPAVTSALGHGQVGEYCYEPSGANGMYFGNSNGEFNALTSYILNNSNGGANVVPSLATLFSNPAYQVSQNQCFVQGLFYYALSYLIIPQAQDLTSPNWDVQFSVQSVDDGLQIISNGSIVGNQFLNAPAVSFSLNSGQSKNLKTLNNGANTLAALWVDDCAVSRYIRGDSISYTTTGAQGYTPLAALAPNVLRGYIYSKSAKKIISGASVAINGNGYSGSSTTDSSGFFQVTGIPDGTYQVTASSNGASYSESVILSHTSASTAIVDFTRGL